VSLATDYLGGVEAGQEFDPWGQVLGGGIAATTRNYTGQHLDGTGLLYYNARYYDPGIGRFISADTIVPGNASGGMEGVAVKPLTVGFHETQFLGKLNGENKLGFWFQLDDRARQQAGSPWGPANPQALNRYAYVQNNPLKYTDPTGHTVLMSGSEAATYAAMLRGMADDLRNLAHSVAVGGSIIAGLTALAAAIGESLGVSVAVALAAVLAVPIWSAVHLVSSLNAFADQLDSFAQGIQDASNNFADGVSITATCGLFSVICDVEIMNNRTGTTYRGELGGSVYNRALADILFGDFPGGGSPFRPGIMVWWCDLKKC
jgi:RHS repeat-associated protein